MGSGFVSDIRSSRQVRTPGESIPSPAAGEPAPPRIPEPRWDAGKDGRDKDGTASRGMGPRRDETGKGHGGDSEGRGPPWDQNETGQDEMGADRSETG
ncbi:unnamed protein product [Coccothraustes coccothraustes]